MINQMAHAEAESRLHTPDDYEGMTFNHAALIDAYDALHDAFRWDDAPAGGEFWQDVAARLDAMIDAALDIDEDKDL